MKGATMKWDPGSVSRYLQMFIAVLWQQKYYDQHKYWSDDHSHVSSLTPQPVILGGGFD